MLMFGHGCSSPLKDQIWQENHANFLFLYQNKYGNCICITTITIFSSSVYKKINFHWHSKFSQNKDKELANTWETIKEQTMPGWVHHNSKLHYQFLIVVFITENYLSSCLAIMLSKCLHFSLILFAVCQLLFTAHIFEMTESCFDTSSLWHT